MLHSTAHRLILAVTFVLAILSFIPVHAKSQSIGMTVFSIGKVTAINALGVSRRLNKKSVIFVGDTINTMADAQIQLRMLDDAFLSIKENSSFYFEKYQLNEKIAINNVSKIKLLRGGFRAITGKIAKNYHKAYSVKTPVATLGIHGTDYSIMLCEKNCLHKGKSSKLDTKVKDGLYVGVLKGGVELNNSAGLMRLASHEYGFVQNIKSAPVMIESPPSFLMFNKITLGDKKRSTLLAKIKQQKNRRKNQQFDVDNSVPLVKKPQHVVSRKFISVFSTEAKSMSISAVDAPTTGINNTSRFALTSPALELNILRSSSGGERSLLDRLLGAVNNSTNLASTDINMNDTVFDENVAASIPLVSKRGFVLSGNAVLSDSGPIIGNTIQAKTFGSNGELISYLGPAVNEANAHSEFRVTSSLNEFGYDADTGIYWGRWAAANISYQSLDGEISKDLVDESIHWMMGVEGSNSVVLPIEGVISYQLIGNTNPSDNLGNIGYLGSASLTADFTNQRVLTSVDLGINEQVWHGQGLQVPISADATFGGTMALNVSGSANANGSGNLVGSFTSNVADDSPNGAIMSYELSATPNGKETTVMGTAAFRRQ